MPGPTAPLETEWCLLLAACSELPAEEKASRIRTLLTSKIRWQVLFDLAGHHGLQPILAQAFSDLSINIPTEELSRWRESYQANLHKALFLSRELIRIVDRLSAAGIEVMPYKGPTLAETIYGDLALRQAGDIDLLIHAKDFARVRAAVAELGFTPHSILSDAEEKAYLKSGYECVFDGTAGRNLLEVQWAIQPHFYAVDLDIEGLFRRAQFVSVAGSQVKSLSAEDLFLVLALHAAKHVWGRLVWLCDLARIGAIPTLNWKWIGHQAKDLGVVRILRVTLLLAQRLLSSPLPVSAVENVPGDSAAGLLAEEVATYLSNEKIYEVESLSYFRLMLRLRERRIDRARFVSRFAFTPGPGEWAAMRLPGPLSPLYRAVRIARLTARIIGGRI